MIPNLAPRGIAVRLFVTCWLVYTLHFATNIVREIYLAVAIGDHFSFRVDEYANLHGDIFEKDGYGWHVGSNPGVSMLAAIPYAIFRPAIDHIVQGVQQSRLSTGQTEPPQYNTPVAKDRAFYEKAWRRGFDVKLGLAAFIMQSLFMAPSSALGVVLMFYVLRRLLGSDKLALWLSLLYAFGTPVFFRTGFLNHNLMMGHIAFIGFIVMWNPYMSDRWTTRQRFFFGGLAGGTALLFDYSGALLLLGLFCYGLTKVWLTTSKKDAVRLGSWYVLGTLAPVGLLWFYQWKSFGHPFYPPQHWMSPVPFIDRGYQGFSWPQFELLWSLLFDYRYGLLTSSPLMILALLCPFFNANRQRRLPWLELTFILSIFLTIWVLFSGVNYTRLQFIYGVCYMAPVFPFLFLPVAIMLTRLPQMAIYLIATLSVAQAWSFAMYRDVAAGRVGWRDTTEGGLGVLDPVLHVLFGGFKLPALTTLSRMGGFPEQYFADGVSPILLFLLIAAVIFVVWQPKLMAQLKSLRTGQK